MATSREPQQDCKEFRISSAAEMVDYEENLEVIVDQQWRLYWVTPLQDLQYTEARLKQYAVHLRGALQSENGTVVEVKVTALPELRQDEDAPVSLQISAEALRGENERQCLYTGIMLSWTKPRRHFEQMNVVHLPLLLCRGGIKAIESVHNTLHILLNCRIEDLPIEKEHMSWMLGLATHFSGAGTDDLHLRFVCPGLGDENVLDFTFQMADLKDMWRSIHGPDKSHITYDEIMNLREECYTVLQDIYGFNLKMLLLTRIKYNGFLLSTNGRIKFSRELARLLLEFVLDIGYVQESALIGRLKLTERFREEEDQ